MLLEELQALESPLIPVRKGTLSAANNQKLKLLGRVLVPLKLVNGRQIIMQFIVVNNLSCEMIVGENSLGPSKLQAVIDMDKREVTFRKLGATVPLVTDSTAEDRDIFAVDVFPMTLEPGATKEVTVRLVTGVPDGSTLFFNHLPSSQLATPSTS